MLEKFTDGPVRQFVSALTVTVTVLEMEVGVAAMTPEPPVVGVASAAIVEVTVGFSAISAGRNFARVVEEEVPVQ